MVDNNYVMASCTCNQGHSECAYQIAWQINPHMHQSESIDLSRALAQHARLKNAIIEAGGNVAELPFVCGAPDSVFIKDTALLSNSPKIPQAWLSVPKFPQRRQEQSKRSAHFMEEGFKVHVPSPYFWEGGDLLIQESFGLLGYGFRSQIEAAPFIEKSIGLPILSLKLVDPWLYHLDTALSIIDETIFICEQAFSPAALQALSAYLPSYEWVNVPYREALKFCVNSVAINRQVILPAGSSWMEGKLEERGLTPRPIDMGEFLKAGGGPACLVAKIHGCLLECRPFQNSWDESLLSA